MKSYTSALLQSCLYVTLHFKGQASAAVVSERAVVVALPDYRGWDQTYFVPYSSGSGWTGDAPKVAFYVSDPDNGGEAIQGSIDTQSVGIVVSVADVPLTTAEKAGTGVTPGRRFDSSSSHLMTGVWVKRDLWMKATNIEDQEDSNGPGGFIQTYSAPIFVVTETCKCVGFNENGSSNTCPGTATKTNAKTKPADVKADVPIVIGVGFNTGQRAEYKGIVNPFLFSYEGGIFIANDAEERTCHGYILQKNGVWIGLGDTSGDGSGSDPNTNGFVFTPLAKSTSGTDMNPQSANMQGYTLTLSLDTGLRTATITSPYKPAGVQPGQQPYTSTWSTNGYDKNLKTTTMIKPAKVMLVTGSAKTAVMGRNVLQAYDYMYDATNHWIGYRKL